MKYHVEVTKELCNEVVQEIVIELFISGSYFLTHKYLAYPIDEEVDDQYIRDTHENDNYYEDMSKEFDHQSYIEDDPFYHPQEECKDILERQTSKVNDLKHWLGIKKKQTMMLSNKISNKFQSFQNDLYPHEIMISDMTLFLIEWYKPLHTSSLIHKKKEKNIIPFDVILKKGDLVIFWDKGIPKQYYKLDILWHGPLLIDEFFWVSFFYLATMNGEITYTFWEASS